mgnify:CR=1 FL=1|tara:strand:+ start:838 stop:1170 length:333 start_codon:yes stop_codon:yes gene_type:complete
MATLYTKIKLYCEANGVSNVDMRNDVILANDSDGKGDYIESWSVEGLTKPTSEQLDNYETNGNAVESNARIDETRQNAYGSWQDQLDEIYHDIDAWKTRIKSIKDSNPKE